MWRRPRRPRVGTSPTPMDDGSPVRPPQPPQPPVGSPRTRQTPDIGAGLAPARGAERRQEEPNLSSSAPHCAGGVGAGLALPEPSAAQLRGEGDGRVTSPRDTDYGDRLFA